MSSREVERLIQQVRLLSPEELEELRKAIDDQARNTSGDGTGSEEADEETLDETLLRKGVIQSIPPPAPATADDDWEPLPITGKPLSESIIEERR
jgi:hypothetical protein